ncbi:MAG: hypothetical protein Q4B15_07575 [Lachnospiraceae bacterium]|nr:hypothetical protein [Lachnospiraceae bacterium]
MTKMRTENFRIHISSAKDLVNFIHFTNTFSENSVLNTTEETFSSRNLVKLFANFPINDVTLITENISDETMRAMGDYFERHDMLNMNPDVYPLGSLVFQF